MMNDASVAQWQSGGSEDPVSVGSIPARRATAPLVICACGRAIPRRAMIDGKNRQLHMRRRCLVCLPFGSPRRRWTGVVLATSVERREKNRTKMKRRYDERRVLTGRCPVHAMRARRRQYVVDLLGAACMICGYARCVGALEFHHVLGKSYPLSGGAFNKKLRDIVDELVKCVLICPNCHGEDHVGVLDQGRVEAALARVAAVVGPLKSTTWGKLGLPYW